MEDYLSRRLAAERERNELKTKASKLDAIEAAQKTLQEKKQVVDAYNAGGLNALNKLVGNSTYNRDMIAGLAGNQAGLDQFRGQTIRNLFDNVDTRTPQEMQAKLDALQKAQGSINFPAGVPPELELTK